MVSGWKMVTLENIAETSSGGTPSRKEPQYYSGEISWITTSELKDCYIYNSNEHISEEALNSSSAKIFSSGTLLVAMYGATIGKLGMLAIDAATNQACCAIMPSASANARFLYYWFLYNRLRIIELGCGAGQPNISQNVIKHLRVLLPSLSEQKRIAGALSDVDELISTLEKLLSKKKAIKQGAMQQLLTGQKRLPGFKGEWKNVKFGETFDIIPNNAFTRAQMTNSGCVKNVHYGDILTKYGAYINADSYEIPYLVEDIDLSRFSEQCYVRAGDIIIADTAEDSSAGKALELINVTCRVLSGQHTLLCRPRVKFAEKFLGYYLNSGHFHNQIISFLVGTKVSSISKTNIVQTNMIIPDTLEEQIAISTILSDMDGEIETLEKKLSKLRQVKQGMMQQLLTGKIRLV